MCAGTHTDMWWWSTHGHGADFDPLAPAWSPLHCGYGNVGPFHRMSATPMPATASRQPVPWVLVCLGLSLWLWVRCNSLVSPIHHVATAFRPRTRESHVAWAFCCPRDGPTAQRIGDTTAILSHYGLERAPGSTLRMLATRLARSGPQGNRARRQGRRRLVVT